MGWTASMRLNLLPSSTPDIKRTGPKSSTPPPTTVKHSPWLGDKAVELSSSNYLQVPATLKLAPAHLSRSASSLISSGLHTRSSSLSLLSSPDHGITSSVSYDFGIVAHKNDKIRIRELEQQLSYKIREIEALQAKLVALKSQCKIETQQADNASKAKQHLESELEDLSRCLFEQANAMVACERRERDAAEQRTRQVTHELGLVREQLDHEHTQLSELRHRLENESSHPSSDINQPSLGHLIPIPRALSVFEAFLSQLATTPMDQINRLYFIKQCVERDIEPCLRLGPKSRLSVRRLLDTIVHQPCFIERHDRLLYQTQQNDHRTSFSISNGTSTLGRKKSVSRQSVEMFHCFGCGLEIKLTGSVVGCSSSSKDVFRFRLRDQDQEWQWLDRACRDRLVAVCDFYVFVRHLRLGLHGPRPIQSLFEESVWLRLGMFWARSGLALSDQERQYGCPPALMRQDSSFIDVVLKEDCQKLLLDAIGSSPIAVRHTTTTMHLSDIFIFFVVTLTLFSPVLAALGDPDAGLILHGDDSKSSGVLGADHKCTTFSNTFTTKKVENKGSTHCALWTERNCQGSLYIVPAHYTIDMPSANIESIVC
ncbi:hypothetical protein PHYBLDRAFT_168211 [Phycomyces blakesleeanus NRRL 1555(-)]|uniref:GDP/GTP exchange factor Sec2 N-terminal domain-containing protein n=1 Tax=Phycomyces blakesleeanus (strain ATCC 8743b / DSM 1359 / FGSC 10004 / NBRC 33097 / NRRL 1555) TaxID=763407 RepID=A0A162PTI0_PHYB8|nr:hypothetical protein PHYBLDRAFT_168211 [Phycomyces blakesleeanus NRRL 1555(-)]OAD73776.1 hypothetical protein PHYBLDRAFT_168211 [Phycomyces blakesleeanus NRRL 1555(-)]|eukprot:XP_018291816.1 hypothetical protein PHYBLDRAFT_168211 [Phycomyces blakesleeanus NRRL 1555(-)]